MARPLLGNDLLFSVRLDPDHSAARIRGPEGSIRLRQNTLWPLKIAADVLNLRFIKSKRQNRVVRHANSATGLSDSASEFWSALLSRRPIAWATLHTCCAEKRQRSFEERAGGPETPIDPTITSLSTRIGAATQRRSSAYSASSVAKPLFLIKAQSLLSSWIEVIVFLAYLRSWPDPMRARSSRSSASANKALPCAVQ